MALFLPIIDYIIFDHFHVNFGESCQLKDKHQDILFQVNITHS